jgi:hypothetical protein
MVFRAWLSRPDTGNTAIAKPNGYAVYCVLECSVILVLQESPKRGGMGQCMVVEGGGGDKVSSTWRYGMDLGFSREQQGLGSYCAADFALLTYLGVSGWCGRVRYSCGSEQTGTSRALLRGAIANEGVEFDRIV